MNYRYEMTFSDLEELLSNPAGIAIAGMGLLVAFVVLACFVVMYVFQSIGLYTIAKRRGIANPGLAWVPVAYSWILGSVSDQYQYVVRGKVCNRRKILLGLAIAGFFLGQSGVLFLANYTTVLDAFDWDAFYFGVGVGRSAVATLAGLVAAALAVYQYISLYDVQSPEQCGLSGVICGVSLFDSVFPVCRSESRAWNAAPPGFCAT